MSDESEQRDQCEPPPKDSRVPKWGSGTGFSEETRTALLSLAYELEKRAEYWRTTKMDPHGIAPAVMVALREMQDAVWRILKL